MFMCTIRILAAKTVWNFMPIKLKVMCFIFHITLFVPGFDVFTIWTSSKDVFLKLLLAKNSLIIEITKKKKKSKEKRKTREKEREGEKKRGWEKEWKRERKNARKRKRKRESRAWKRKIVIAGSGDTASEDGHVLKHLIFCILKNRAQD